ncbi:ASCH domain-containing protein [Pelagerythrobacter rhizovicinus]|uniref:ASCH domain-containing protein n=1 Tax=Pelagerythrobacter rhizovicinus TaxID=2268576 RepID=A0A4V1QWL6_9SPHN|nr:ASCH domain-containing protein [Pelagerythrobacter rhizovicinus]RXZ66586.1 ASCH domain-containing protein [Pelagerythrobacter rhizovicinus]
MIGRHDVLISIYPEFAEAILRGEKTVELRRRIPGLRSGMRMWIYATKPVGAILGYAMVGGVSKGPPEKMWKIFGDSTGIEREHFDSYFLDSSVAVCITLTGVREGVPLPSHEFKRVRPSFHPPQLFTRISDAEAEYLDKMLFPMEFAAEA